MGQDMKEGQVLLWGGVGVASCLLWKSREPRREIYIPEVEVVILDIWPRVVRSASKSSKSGSVRVCTRMAALTLSQARPSGTQFLSHSSLIQGPDTLKISLLSTSVQGHAPSCWIHSQAQCPQCKLFYSKMHKCALSFQLYNHPLVPFVAT